MVDPMLIPGMKEQLEEAERAGYKPEPKQQVPVTQSVQVTEKSEPVIKFKPGRYVYRPGEHTLSDTQGREVKVRVQLSGACYRIIERSRYKNGKEVKSEEWRRCEVVNGIVV